MYSLYVCVGLSVSYLSCISCTSSQSIWGATYVLFLGTEVAIRMPALCMVHVLICNLIKSIRWWFSTCKIDGLNVA